VAHLERRIHASRTKYRQQPRIIESLTRALDQIRTRPFALQRSRPKE
jgi:hypothetical protein